MQRFEAPTHSPTAQRVLLIEDYPDDAWLIRDLLRDKYEQRFAVTHVASLQEGLEHLARHEPYDVILLDLNLADSLGLDTFKRAQRAAPDTPIVILTGHPDAELAAQALALGAKDFLDKNELNRSLITHTIRHATLRQQVETQLRIQEERFRQLAETIRDAFWMVDAAQDEMIYLSPAYEIIWGRPREAFFQKQISFLDTVHPDDRKRIEAALPQQRCGGYEQEYRIIRPDGSVRWIWDRAFPVLNETGEVYRIAGVAADITAEKRAQEKLQESLQRFELVSLATNDLIYEWDIRTDRTTFNRAAQTLFGYPIREIEGKAWWPEKMHPDDWPGAVQRTEEILVSGDQVHTKEYRFRRADGSYAQVLDRGYIVRDPQGEPLRMIGAMTDLSESRRYEEALRKSEARFRTLSDSLPIGILLLDGETMIYANREVSRVTGYSPEELSGANVMSLIVPQQRARARQRMKALLQEGTDLPSEERQIVTKGGQRLWVENTTTLIELEGRPVVLQIAMDITERKQAEEDRKRLLSDLAERVKELNVLHQVSLLLRDDARDMDDLLADLVELLPSGWRHPSATAAKVTLGERVAVKKTFVTGAWVQRSTFELRDGTPCSLEMSYQELSPGDPFLPEEYTLLDSLAELLRAYLDRRRAKETIEALNDDLSQRVVRLDALRQIDVAITSSQDLAATLEHLVRQVRRSLRVDAADVFLFDRAAKVLTRAAGIGFSRYGNPPLQVSLAEPQGYVARAAREQQPFFISDIRQTEPPFRYQARLEREGFVSHAALPLIAKGELQGVLSLFHRAPLEVSQDWREYASSLALQAAIAIDSARLFQDLQQANSELARAYDATIEGWGRALDLKDEETAGHSRRVTELTVRLAKRLGVQGEALVNVWRGAILHDIGKMGVPDSILLKPGKLSTREWETMKSHTSYAYELLAPIPFLRQALDIPYGHHEKWDGSGYPRGLKGEEIPLAARIFAVVDVYDALTSVRPYRPAWSKERTLELIKRDAGSHFDPRVVEVFLALIEEDEALVDGGTAPDESSRVD